MPSLYNNEDFYDYWISDARSYNVPTDLESNDLAIRTRQGDQLAFEELLKRNKRLIIKFAYKFTDNKSMLPDLFGCGSMGLYEATLSYDETRGNFISYASMFIRKYMNKAMADYFPGYKLSDKFFSKMIKYRIFESKYDKAGIPLPCDEELKKIFKISDETLRLLKNYKSLSVRSIYDPLPNNEENNFLDFVVVEENQFDYLEDISMKELLSILKQELSPYEYYVIYYRFLVDKPLTLIEISKRLGTSK